MPVPDFASSSGDNSRFQLFMRLNQEAFEGTHYSVAYHLLAAAFHEAKDAGDLTKLLTVQDTAHAQADRIDEHAPEYEFSNHSTSQRGIISEGLFHALARQAKALETLFRMDEQTQSSSRELTAFEFPQTGL